MPTRVRPNRFYLALAQSLNLVYVCVCHANNADAYTKCHTATEARCCLLPLLGEPVTFAFRCHFFCSALSPRNRKNEHQISDICNGNSNASHYIITALSSYTRRTFLFISNTFEGFINGQTERAPCTDPTVLRKCTFGGAIQFDLSLTTRVSVSYQRICHPAIHRFHPHCGLSH